MPSIINSDDGVVSGSSGLKSTGGNDGILVFQKNGTETARINTDNQLVVAAGTAALPVIAPTGDLNTGMFFPAADTIAFADGGVETVRINSAGNVGIGTTTPAVKLDVNGAITASGAIRASGVATNIYPVVSGTAVSASGSSVDFTSIPSWVKRITLVLDQVSYASGTNNGVIRIGSGSLATSGYVGSSTSISETPTVSISTVTSGFGNLATSAAGTTMTGIFTITNITGDTWVCSGSYQRIGDARIQFMNFSIALGGTLDRLSVVALTSTFDAGTINILYE